MAVTMPVSAAFAGDGASADGATAGSPGVISGNSVQLPVHVPVNVCGNTVNVVGLLNPAMGNTCANGGEDDQGGSATSGDATSGDATSGDATSGDATAEGGTTDAPGVISGNDIQIPVHLPVNVSGNGVGVVGVANPGSGNQSSNTGGHPATPTTTPKPAAPVKSHPAPHTLPEQGVGALAHTGTGLTAPAVAGSFALILTGATLYRRCRPGRVR
ncbi:chaplin family protein [Streptomyces sp. NPDC002520]